ncbi:MAG: ATP-binding protein, partial [Pseudomonadota bacterium]
REMPRSMQATIPYFELSETDLIGIFEPETSIQWMRLRSAMKTLKLLQLSPGLSSSGVFIKTHKLKHDFEVELEAHQARLERPDSVFNIHKLPQQLECECVEPSRSRTESQYWGGTSLTDLNDVAPLISRVEQILTEPELRPIFSPPKAPSAFEALEKFLTDTNVSVLRISLEFLPVLHKVREIVAQSLSRYMLSMARSGLLRQQPLVIAIDEAHQVLKKNELSAAVGAPHNVFDSIAKEGRKYGLTLCMATQRPADIPEGVLSQVGAFIVHRIIGQHDRQAVERAAGGISEEHYKALATLSPGEALLIGAGITEPQMVRMTAPAHAPHSHGPNYQSAWKR